jgi:hypothetical protein
MLDSGTRVRFGGLVVHSRSRLAGTAPLGLALGLLATPAWGQVYTVSADEVGALPTAYQKRNNWRYYGDYRHTTMIASGSDPLACNESPCLDDGEPGDVGPDLTRGGTATATVSNMVPGTYRIELRYNQTVNRSTAVPWSATSDAADDNQRSGSLDQKNTAPGTDHWLVLGGSGQDPVAVASSLTFVFGSATTTFNGSLSYGGIRLQRTGDLPPAGEGGAGGEGGGVGGGDSGGGGEAGGGEAGGGEDGGGGGADPGEGSPGGWTGRAPSDAADPDEDAAMGMEGMVSCSAAPRAGRFPGALASLFGLLFALGSVRRRRRPLGARRDPSRAA